MRTTIDLPQDLLRQAKATAALRGVSLKDLITEFVSKGLSEAKPEPKRLGMSGPPPVCIDAGRFTNLPSTNAEIEALFLEEDLIKYNLA